MCAPTTIGERRLKLASPFVGLSYVDGSSSPATPDESCNVKDIDATVGSRENVARRLQHIGRDTVARYLSESWSHRSVAWCQWRVNDVDVVVGLLIARCRHAGSRSG